MSLDLATIGVALDTSQLESGSQIAARTFASVADAGDKVTASTSRAQQQVETYVQSQQRMDSQLSEGIRLRDQYLARVAAQTTAENEATVARIRQMQANGELNLSFGTLSRGMQQATEATVAHAAAQNAVATASTSSYGGVNRLIRSMDSLAFSAAGVHGPLSTITTSLGLMTGGTALMLGVAGGAAAVALAWGALTGAATKATAEVDKLVKSLNKARDARLGIDTDQELGKLQPALAAVQQHQDYLENLQAILTGRTGKADPVVAQQQEDATTKAQALGHAIDELKRKKDELNDKTLQELDHLKALASAHQLTAANYRELDHVISDYTKRATDSTLSMKDQDAAWGKVAEAQGLLNRGTKAATTLAEQQRVALEAVTVVAQNSAVEQLKASGDVIGAAHAEYAAQLEAIKSKYDHIVALGHLTQAAADKAISDQTDIVWTKAQITIGAELDKRRAQWAAASDKITNQAATNRELEAKFTRDGAQAFEDAYNLKLAKITEDLTKTTDAINARKDLTTAEKVWYDTIAIVTAGLQKRGVELQRNNDLEKLARDSAKELANADEAYQVAVLNAAGKTKEAHALEIANRERNLELSLQQQVADHKLEQGAANRIIMLSRETAALNEQAAQQKSSAALLGDAYKTLGKDIERAMAASFDNIFTKGISSFSSLFTEIEKLFVRMLAQLAAAMLTAELEKSFKNMLTGSGASTLTPGQTQPDGSPLALGAGWSTPKPGGGLSVGAAATLVAGVALGFVSSMMAAADALNAARLKWQASASSFDKTITDWATSISVTAGSFAATMAASAKTVAGYQAQAFGVFATAPGTAGTALSGLAANAQGAFDRGGMAGLKALEDFMRFVAERAGNIKDTNAAIAQLNKDLALTADAAAKLAAIDLAAFLTGIQNAYTATLPGGANQLTLAGFETARQNAANGIATAEAPGGTLSVTAANAALATIQQTYTNQVQNFLKSLNQGDLETLLPTLTGATLAYATALDAALKATQDALIVAREQTAQGGLYGRLAAATSGKDSAQYAQMARDQQQRDEITAAENKRTADIAAHAGAAAIAADDYTIALIKTTQAAENAKRDFDAVAAAVAAAAASAAAYAQFTDSLALRNLKAQSDLTGNPKDLAAYNAAVRKSVEDGEDATLKATAATNHWTQAQIDAALASLHATQANEDFATSMVNLRNTLAAAKAAADAEAIAMSDLQVRSLNASGQAGAGSVLALKNQQEAEYQKDVALKWSPQDLAYLLTVQKQERDKMTADNLAAQQAAFNQAQAANSSAAAAATQTFAPASATSVNLAVGTSQSTSNMIAGLLQSQISYQMELPVIRAILQRMVAQHLTLDAIDQGLGAAAASADLIAGIPPSNR